MWGKSFWIEIFVKHVLSNYSIGYANAKIYKCDNDKCPRPTCFISGGSSKDDSFPCLSSTCTGRFRLIRHVSFVDCPGHDILMATMLNGAAVMDAGMYICLVFVYNSCVWCLVRMSINMETFLYSVTPRRWEWVLSTTTDFRTFSGHWDHEIEAYYHFTK